MSSLDTIAVEVEAASGNVKPLLHEILHALRRLADGEQGTIIDLRGLPLAPGEEKHIEAVLGKGELRVELDALGPTVVQETSYAGVWLVTHRNTEFAVVARFIEVTRMPELLFSQTADIQCGITRLETELAGCGEEAESARKNRETGETRDTA